MNQDEVIAVLKKDYEERGIIIIVWKSRNGNSLLSGPIEGPIGGHLAAHLVIFNSLA